MPATLLALLLAAALALACGDSETPSPPTAAEAAPAASAAAEEVPHVAGTARCIGCHPDEAAAWHGSDHDRALQVATPETVLGDFDGATLEHFGSHFSFERDGDRFRVRTEGADGKLRDYTVEYTFGVEPLQQYLVKLPRGRLQALAAAWDTRPASAGGQRWFHLHPDEPVPPGDALHWTGPAGRWNAMCADCHSTHLVKGYDPQSDSYQTRWDEPDVACEACHGPGSAHVAWAEAGMGGAADHAGFARSLANDGEWVFAPGARIAHRVPPRTGHAEIDTCADCHSRRLRIAEPDASGDELLDHLLPSLLERGLYYPDGQILDEVYVWGSFVQSKMYAAGVTCSDCHDPHSLKIAEPDAACARCHRSEVFATPQHHHHRPGSPGASCVACHMPSRLYMVVDARRDHGFRVPRPDLTLAIGVPNACGSCHARRGAAWADAAVAQWRGGRGAPPHWGEVLAAGREHRPDAPPALAALVRDRDQPAIVRATAVSLLREQLGPGALPALEAALGDRDALVRHAAVATASVLPPADRLDRLRPRLRDPVRAVRMEAAHVLADVPDGLWPGGDPGPAFAEALGEYRHSLELDADRAPGEVGLGDLAAARGDVEGARLAYERALRLSPFFVPAAVNLAELYRVIGDDAEGVRVLRRMLERVPDSADLHHALGLALVRTGERKAALPELARAAELAPRDPRFAWVHAIALRDAGRLDEARREAERLATLAPGDPRVEQLLSELGAAP